MRTVWLPPARPASASHTPPSTSPSTGWPTGPEPLARPAGPKPSETVIRTIHALSARLNIERYTLFDLRDVAHPDPSGDSHLFNFFGITNANYQPKPAFSVVRTLIQELGVR